MQNMHLNTTNSLALQIFIVKYNMKSDTLLTESK